ncbi:MAG: tRNA preQ1(34) S-adenosylmethionine ribosyltransferase-isomerase QueA [Phycisphaerales bacterium]|nr:tRNA preQ1(34) S-adenosylmethionine ribosyltransferase-isomerase QueA [Phycisphaerales bacterium]
MKTDELDYELPPSLIAREPVTPRDASRLLVYRRAADVVEHRVFLDLPTLLKPGDLLVANNTRVLPAKLQLHKSTGGAVSGLFVKELKVGLWQVLLRSRGRLKPGAVLRATKPWQARDVVFRVVRCEAGEWQLAVEPAADAASLLEAIGETPLPPYIEHARANEVAGGAVGVDDSVRYQTVYASDAGSLAAPTAGLHFTPELLAALAAHQIDRTFVTLHVGLGTFLPVQTDDLNAHKMHCESYIVPAATARRIAKQRAGGGRVVVVGTTAVRTLETTAATILNGSISGEEKAIAGTTDLLIQPGFEFKLTDALITNFHLPRSTLLALVGALTGLPRLKAIYQEAIRECYRFYSYGDAMLILP